jgi:signal transduction histidine kinase
VRACTLASVSLFGTLLVACAALYAQAAVIYGWLWMYGARRDVVSLSMSFTAAGCTVFALGAVFLTADVSSATAEMGARLLYAGGYVAAPSFLFVALEVAGMRHRRLLTHAAVAVAATATLLALLGAVHDPASVRPMMAHEPTLTTLGAVLVTIAVSVMVVAFVVLARAWGRRAGARWILVGAAPGAIGAIVEQTARLRGYEPAFALTVLGTILMLVSSWVLLRRFAAVGDRLRAQKSALESSHASLVRAQSDRSRAEHLADVGELSVVLAAEISRPMASLRRSVAELDAAAVEAGDARGTLDEIDAETRHLNHLIGDLLVFARPAQEERHEVNVATLVEDALRDVRAQTRTSVPATLSIDPSLSVECEPEAMRRAVAQILENATTAANGESLSVRARADGERGVRIDITDPGEGMDTAVRKRALEPFFTTRAYGTGLGLAIVARVARSHGGRVEIQSAHGVGTTVSLSLPRKRARG